MILVTGGAGFVGANFVLEWLAHSDEPIVNLDALTYAGSLANLAAVAGDARHVFVHGDVGDAGLLEQLFAQYRPRAVVHLAAESHVDESIRAAGVFVRTNVVGTYQLLEAARAHWSSLDSAARAAFRFLYVSTDEVYGSLAPDQAPFDESHAYAPNNPYAASKAGGDHLVRAWHQTYGLPVLTVHSSNNYGPYQLPEKLIPRCIRRALDEEPLPLFGDGQQVRDWIHVRDHCAALRRVLGSGVIGRVYNVGARCQRTNLSVVQQLCAVLDELRARNNGQSYAQLIRHVPDRPGHDRRYAIDPSRLERELGWRSHIEFEVGLRQTVQWTLEHESWVAQALTRLQGRAA